MKPDEPSPSDEPPAGCLDASGDRRWIVEVGNFHPGLPAPTDSLRAAVEQVLSDAQVAAAQISVAVVDDPTIRDLNRSHLEHDYATDVLSYPLSDDDQRLEGEIIVSRDTASRNAAEANWTPESELVLYAVHGALHLVGYRDKTPADARAMRAAEAATLDRLGIARSASDSRWTSSSAPATTVGESTSP